METVMQPSHCRFATKQKDHSSMSFPASGALRNTRKLAYVAQ